MFHMSEKQMANMYKLNQERRGKLLSLAQKEKTPQKKLEFVAKYFLNALPIETIALIDGVETDKIEPFLYDYSFLEDYSSNHIREKQVRECPIGRGVSLPVADVDVRQTENGKDKIKIYPTIYSLKLGTCIMFASEIQRFAHDFQIPSEIVKKIDFCYDHFEGKSTDFEPIETDRIIKMEHFYNVFTINGKKYKLDIAGILTAKDFNSRHPNTFKTNEQSLYFSEDLNSSPFELPASTKTINLLKETQAE